MHKSTRYDIRGRCVETTFQPAGEYKNLVAWRVENELEEPAYSQTYSYNVFGAVLEKRDAQGNRAPKARLPSWGRRFQHQRGQVRKPYLASATFTADGLPETMI